MDGNILGRRRGGGGGGGDGVTVRLVTTPEGCRLVCECVHGERLRSLLHMHSAWPMFICIAHSLEIRVFGLCLPT